MGIIAMSIKKKNIIIACILPVFLIGGLSQVIPFIYAIIDDRSMMEILSGQYLGYPDAHAIFLQYWYALALTGLYHICSQIDWYALSFFAAQWFCMSLILYRIMGKMEQRKEKIWKIILALSVFLVIGLQTLTQITFTTTAAVLGASILYWYATTERMTIADLIVLGILEFLTMQIRIEVFLMVLPVGIVFWCIRMWRKKGEKREKIEWYVPVVVFVVLFIGLLGKEVGYGNEAWKEYNIYNQYRSDIYDYPDYTFPPYESAEELYAAAGIDSKSRARTLMNYNYTADDKITPEFFGNYIHTYKKIYPVGQNRTEKLIKAAKTYVKGLLDGRFHLIQSIGMLVLGLLFLLSIWRKHWSQAIELLGLLGIQFVLWIYLLYKGRVPERVIYSMNLLLVVIAILICREISSSFEQEFVKKIWKKGLTAAVFALVMISVVYGNSIRIQNEESYKRNESVENLKQYCSEYSENFYFNDVTTMAFTTWNVKLWRNKTYTMNYMSLGDWMSFSPVWKKKLEQQGITSVREALYQRDNVYLICTFDKGLEYLTSLYENTTCAEVDRAGLFHIYKLQSL